MMTDTETTKIELHQHQEQRQQTTMQVSECLTASHAECIGWYRDQLGELLVRCLCKCHESGGTT
jgi:hypothetical protein